MSFPILQQAVTRHFRGDIKKWRKSCSASSGSDREVAMEQQRTDAFHNHPLTSTALLAVAAFALAAGHPPAADAAAAAAPCAIRAGEWELIREALQGGN